MLFGFNLMKVFWFVLVFVDMEMNFLILFKVGFFCILLFLKKFSCLFCVFCIFFIVYIYWFYWFNIYIVIYIKFFMIVFIELC